MSEEEEENNAREVGHGRKGIVIIKRDYCIYSCNLWRVIAVMIEIFLGISTKVIHNGNSTDEVYFGLAFVIHRIFNICTVKQCCRTTARCNRISENYTVP